MSPEDGAVAVAQAEVITAAEAVKVAVEQADPHAMLAAIHGYADAQIATVAAVQAAREAGATD